MQIAEALKQAKQQLVDSDSAQLDAEVLLGFCLQKDRSYLFAHPEQELSKTIDSTYFDLISRRAAGQPVAHIVGQREFWSLPLKVTTDTLIPRPETECLVEAALQIIPADNEYNVLDLGTGTGAIALALASERKKVSFIATDINSATLTVARDNALRLKLTNISFVHADWFEFDRREPFNLIVSNPPYISADDEHLQNGDVRFENSSALVADNNGLAAIQIIIETAPRFLCASGWLLLEHGYQQGQNVRQMFTESGFIKVHTGRDYAGNERFTRGQLR